MPKIEKSKEKYIHHTSLAVKVDYGGYTVEASFNYQSLVTKLKGVNSQ